MPFFPYPFPDVLHKCLPGPQNPGRFRPVFKYYTEIYCIFPFRFAGFTAICRRAPGSGPRSGPYPCCFCPGSPPQWQPAGPKPPSAWHKRCSFWPRQGTASCGPPEFPRFHRHTGPPPHRIRSRRRERRRGSPADSEPVPRKGRRLRPRRGLQRRAWAFRQSDPAN